MSIEVGKIKIVKEINRYEGGLTFFIFKQNRIEYHAMTFTFADEKEGYVAFYLNNKYSKLFEQSDYNTQILIELIEQSNSLYFLGFADEDPESEMIEYVGEIDKKDVLNCYKKSK